MRNANYKTKTARDICKHSMGDKKFILIVILVDLITDAVIRKIQNIIYQTRYHEIRTLKP